MPVVRSYHSKNNDILFLLTTSNFCRPGISRDRESQRISNQLAITSEVFSPICTISKNPVTGFIIVRQCSRFQCAFWVFPFSQMHGPTKSSTHNMCYRMMSGLGLGGSRPCFLSLFLLTVQFGQVLYMHSHNVLRPIHMWYCSIVSSNQDSPGCVGQSDLSIQSQSHIEPHSRERSWAHRYRDIHTVE